MRKSLIALAVLSTFIGSAYAQTDTGSQSAPATAFSSASLASDPAGSTPGGQTGQDGVMIVSELAPSLSEAACGCYSPPGSCP